MNAILCCQRVIIISTLILIIIIVINMHQQLQSLAWRPAAADPAASFHATGRTHTPNMLPSNLTGSSRDQAAAYRDAMATVRKEGTPYVDAGCDCR